jgi:hypothetical protein
VFQSTSAIIWQRSCNRGECVVETETINPRGANNDNPKEVLDQLSEYHEKGPRGRRPGDRFGERRRSKACSCAARRCKACRSEACRSTTRCRPPRRGPSGCGSSGRCPPSRCSSGCRAASGRPPCRRSARQKILSVFHGGGRKAAFGQPFLITRSCVQQIPRQSVLRAWQGSVALRIPGQSLPFPVAWSHCCYLRSTQKHKTLADVVPCTC